jgi:hypothetical protein
MKKFFAAANTENGFRSLFDEIFAPERFRRIYILKGGPGTGKSTLMKKIGEAAEKRGYDAEYICCSSEPDSLDGILIEALSVAVLDGTAPHTTDPVYPGAVERIVNLGEAFDFRLLEEKRDDLLPLLQAKKDSYRTAYRFLSAVGRIEKENDELMRSFYLSEKASAAIKRMISSFGARGNGQTKKRYISAICGKGVYRLDTLAGQANKIYAITDKNGSGYLFMDTLYARLCEERFSMTVCRSPVTGERTEAIFLEEERILFTVDFGQELSFADKVINSMRFVDKEKMAQKRQRLRFIGKCRAAVLDGAVSCFEEAGVFHREAERIYGACVNFSEIEIITKKIIDEIFANNV